LSEPEFLSFNLVFYSKSIFLILHSLGEFGDLFVVLSDMIYFLNFFLSEPELLSFNLIFYSKSIFLILHSLGEF